MISFTRPERNATEDHPVDDCFKCGLAFDIIYAMLVMNEGKITIPFRILEDIPRDARIARIDHYSEYKVTYKIIATKPPVALEL